ARTSKQESDPDPADRKPPTPAARRRYVGERVVTKVRENLTADDRAQEARNVHAEGRCEESVFRAYAKQLGPDMEKFDTDLADPATAERVKADQCDGLDLGVQGTPAFVVGGTRIQ
ncbi:hypothetical protein G3M53_63930, partial [Streptomyces sp. SID7982]|nr:hypothetical protein [Streptomyces sp. SID7982]